MIIADDYGLSEGVNAAILQLARERKLTGVSVLVDLTSKSEAMLLIETGVKIGLHLDLSEKEKGRAGFWITRSMFASRSKLINEFTRQLIVFRALFGRDPYMIDGHLYVHTLPCIRVAYVKFLTQHFSDNLPLTRLPLTSSLLGNRIKGESFYKILFWSILARRFRSQYPEVTSNRALVGIYSFRESPEVIAEIFEFYLSITNAETWMVCHPSMDVRNGDFRKFEMNILGKKDSGHA